MTSLKPSLEEVLENNIKRTQELDQRAQRWQEKRQRFIRKLSLSSAIILPISARIMAFGGSMSWIAYILFFLMGALLGWLIARFSIGMVRSMFVYIGGSWPIWLLCYVSGWWGSAPNSGPLMMAAGPLLFMICGWLGWIIIGALLGFISDTYDNDNIHM
jgi:hypothetical protein